MMRGLVRYPIKFSDDTFGRLDLPNPFTSADMERVIAMVKALALEKSEPKAEPCSGNTTV
jgi:hypothetical protein